MSDGHCFISYSNADGLDFATKLATDLESGQPFIKVWFDKNEMSSSGDDWDDQISSAISNSKCLLFVMSEDSTGKGSNCKEEWTWALKCKKPVICIFLDKKAEDQFRLNNRQKVDFSSNFDAGLAKLRKAIIRLDTQEGLLDELNYRLAEAKRDLHRAKSEEEKPRIKAEIDELTEQIKRQEEIVKNPKAAEEKTEKNIQSGLERERKPVKEVISNQLTKFINPPPGVAPNYFQDRFVETKQIVDFLNNDSQRLMTIVGRAGVGKTAMVCRLLKALERGELPDDLGEMKVDGIVYLSETGSHRVNFANVFADLIKLLPKDAAERLEGIYKNPQTSTGNKMRALLDAFPSGRVILLLDNFETLIDPESLNLRDSELTEALNALLGGQHHAVKAVITTRIAPRDLGISEPGRQHHLSLDEGLESPYAENVLREMDADGRVGLKTAPDALLNKAREKTRGYPRALEALYAILSVDRYTTLEELLEISLPDEVVQKLVGEAFNRLDPSAQKVMQALAVYNRPVSPAAIDYLLQPHLPSIDSALVLNRLVNMHFARREAGRYYLHPADKEYAFSLIENREQRVENSESPEPQTTDLQSLVSNHLSFTQHDLLNRAADYFAQARKPRTEWKKLDDLAAQLAEFELRCEAGDYDTACSVLNGIDFDYLYLWGHYRLTMNLHFQVKDKLQDKNLIMSNMLGLGRSHRTIGQIKEAIIYYESGLHVAQKQKDRSWEGILLGSLGIAYYELGDVHKAIEIYQQTLFTARELGERRNESVWLGNLGNAYSALGDAHKAIEFHELALVIDREIGDRTGEAFTYNSIGAIFDTSGNAQMAIEYFEKVLTIAREIGSRQLEGTALSNIALQYVHLDNPLKGIEYYQQALQIAREIGDTYGESKRLNGLAGVLINKGDLQNAIKQAQESLQIGQDMSSPEVCVESSDTLAKAFLFSEKLIDALQVAKNAEKYEQPHFIFNISTLHGIIALRQGERKTAQEAFAKSIAQADEILAKTPDFYDALDAKGLALCGLVLCRGAGTAPAGLAKTGRDDLAPTVNDAIETFRKARKIAPHAGVVKSVLRLFDELVKCDTKGILKDVRKAAEGIGVIAIVQCHEVLYSVEDNRQYTKGDIQWQTAFIKSSSWLARAPNHGRKLRPRQWDAPPSPCASCESPRSSNWTWSLTTGRSPPTAPRSRFRSNTKAANNPPSELGAEHKAFETFHAAGPSTHGGPAR